MNKEQKPAEEEIYDVSQHIPSVATFLKASREHGLESKEAKLAYKRLPLSVAIVVKMKIRRALKAIRKEQENDLQQEQSASRERDQQRP